MYNYSLRQQVDHGPVFFFTFPQSFLSPLSFIQLFLQSSGAFFHQSLQPFFFIQLTVFRFFYSQHRLYLRVQFRFVNWFCQKCVGSTFQRFYPAFLVGASCGNNYNWNGFGCLVRFQDLANFVAIHFGHYNIEQYNIRFFGKAQFNSFSARKCADEFYLRKGFSQQST